MRYKTLSHPLMGHSKMLGLGLGLLRLVIFQSIVVEFLSDETGPHALYMDVLYIGSLNVRISVVGGSILRLSQINDSQH